MRRDVRDNLWTLIAAPTIWAVHFLASYVAMAVVCARFWQDAGAVAGARVGVGAATLIAAALCAAIGLRAWREWRRGQQQRQKQGQEKGSERERFLEFATLLLAGLSVVGVLFVGLPVLLIDGCGW